MGRRMNYWKQVLNLELGTWCFSVGQSCPTLCDLMDCSLPWGFPGNSCHSLCQRIFPTQGSNPGLHIVGRRFTVWATREVLKGVCLCWKWKSLSHVWLYWSRKSFSSPGDLSNPGIQPGSRALWADSLPTEPQGKPNNTGVDSLSHLQRIFLTQESNQGLLYRRQILYQLSYEGSPRNLEFSSNYYHQVSTLLCCA